MVWENLDASRADALSRSATLDERAGQWAGAEVLHEAARRMMPQEDRYALNLARSLAERAQHDRQLAPDSRQIYLAQAVAMLRAALTISPLNPDHWRNLARAHRIWGELAPNPRQRSRHLVLADVYYRRTARLQPGDPLLQEEWKAAVR